MGKDEYMSMYEQPLGKYLKRALHVWEKKKCIFCGLSTVQNQLFWTFHGAGKYMITLHHDNVHNICDVFELYQNRVTNLTSFAELEL